MASVLLVDCAGQDETEMYREYLDITGLHSLEVCDGADAFDRARASVPDVIVTDLLLPPRANGDGVDLIRRIRYDNRTKDIGIIVLTGVVFDAQRGRALDAGCDIFLPKPCLPDVLLAEVRRAAAIARRRRFRRTGE